MSFPVPVKYLLNENQDATVVVYDDGKEIEGLPDPGCFSQENINKFATMWLASSYSERRVEIGNVPLRAYGLYAAPFKIVFLRTDSTMRSGALLANSETLTIVVAPFMQIDPRYGSAWCTNCVKLLAADLGTLSLGSANGFNSCKLLSLLILRATRVCALSNLNIIKDTPYDENGTGGEIYIPKYLYDHLGDGSALDYKAAANWSTIDGYGTITWRQIEGSEYEFNYADGTPIGSV
jgi:hypothetical protein